MEKIFWTEERYKTVSYKQKTVTYSKNDIMELIINDLRKDNMEVVSIRFICEHEVKTDDWGLNPRDVYNFKGVKVEVREVSELD